MALYGLPYNADALNNIEIGAQAGRLVGILFTAPVTANLNSFSMALAYGPGYSLGTGGSVKCALVADDGTASHFPTGADLAAVTSNTPVGADNTESMITFTFGSPYGVTAGTRYHMVFTQMDASPTANWVSMDGTYNLNPTTPVQPMYADSEMFVNYKYNTGNPWEHLPNTSPSPTNWHFSDGTDYGNSIDYTPVVVALRNVGGTNYARLNFTPSANVTVQRVFVRLYRLSGTTQDLTIALKDAGGTIVSGTVTAATVVAMASGAAPADGTWVGFSFTALALASGHQYFLELSSPSETIHYRIYPVRTAIDANWSGVAKSNRFNDGYFEYSTNSGGAWTKESGETDYKLQAYFSTAAPTTSSRSKSSSTRRS